MEFHSLQRGVRHACGALLLTLAAAPGFAAELLKPFVLAEPAGESVAAAEQAVKEKLKGAGLEVVGAFDPYGDDTARVIGVTSPALKEAAARHAFGGFGGVIRVAVTANQGAVEVSYLNPEYVGHAYHIGDLTPLTEQLKKALGAKEPFGAKGLEREALEKYHYMMFMPSFSDEEIVGHYNSHEDAVARVSRALADPRSDMKVAWKVKINDNQTLFGVSLVGGKWEGGRIPEIMKKIDTGTPRSTASLPWELLVTGSELAYLPGKYRIALMFPDLTMGTFMQISEVPDQMADSAAEVAKIAEESQQK